MPGLVDELSVRRTLGAALVLSLAGCTGLAPHPSSTSPSTAAASIDGPSPALQSPASTPSSTQPNRVLLPKVLPAAKVDGATAGRLQAVLDGLVAAGAPDAIAAVITEDGIWSGAAGIDGPASRAAQPTDESSIGSISQILTASTVLRLADAGRIELASPLSAYLDGVAFDTGGATVMDALAFNTGIGDTVPGSLERAGADCGHAWTRKEIIETFPQPSSAAGTDYLYSNPTYKLLGFGLEQVTGEPLREVIHDTVQPEDANRLLLQGPDASPPKPWALPLDGRSGYVDLADVGAGDALPCLAIASLAYAGAGMASDAPTLARWLWRLFAGDVISSDSLTLMTSLSGNHGLGINRLEEFPGTKAFGRVASLPGYSAVVAVLPAERIVAVLFVNDGDATPADAMPALVNAAEGT